MKKIICLIVFTLTLCTAPCLAAPHGGGHGGHGSNMGRPPIHGSVSMGHRPPIHRPPAHSHIGMRPPIIHHPIYRPMPIRPVYRPYYYSSMYYPSTTYYTTYTYYPTPTTATTPESVVPAQTEVNTVVVKDEYAGINTAANVINAAANVAATIKYLSW
ncbi:hypothetical protein HDR58_10770 [bacterium]|nr:hypothetical protein [bacterium]